MLRVGTAEAHLKSTLLGLVERKNTPVVNRFAFLVGSLRVHDEMQTIAADLGRPITKPGQATEMGATLAEREDELVDKQLALISGCCLSVTPQSLEYLQSICPYQSKLDPPLEHCLPALMQAKST